MLHTNRFLGGVLLVAGTSIGGGMLLIPVMTAFAGFAPSLLLLAICWLFMFITAFLFLDVNLSIPGDINLISMAEATLGKTGKIVSWITYLLLLYALVAAYISGSSSLFSDAISYLTGFTLPKWLSPLPILILFGIFVYLGTRTVDYVNRLLMLGLVIAYILLVIFLPSHVDFSSLTHMDGKALLIAIPILFTSYGFHIIIPSLTTYMHRNVRKLRWTIFIGSLIPFLVYALWEFLILGIVPLYGDNGLVSAWIKGDPSTKPLMQVLTNPWISIGARLFAFFALVTSFLGVSLSLSSFLRDGLKLKKTETGKLYSCLLTFIPPLLFVYFYEKGFMIALQYAAVFVMILLAIIPALMAWKLENAFYRSFFGRCLLVTIIIGSVFVIVIHFVGEAGGLKGLIQPYLQNNHVPT